MEVLGVSTPDSFVHDRGSIKSIGFDRHTIYIAHLAGTNLEIWKINCLIPNSWSQVYSKKFSELNYSYFAYSKHNNIIYALIIAVFVCFKESFLFVFRKENMIIRLLY